MVIDTQELVGICISRAQSGWRQRWATTKQDNLSGEHNGQQTPLYGRYAPDIPEANSDRDGSPPSPKDSNRLVVLPETTRATLNAPPGNSGIRHIHLKELPSSEDGQDHLFRHPLPPPGRKPRSQNQNHQSQSLLAHRARKIDLHPPPSLRGSDRTHQDPAPSLPSRP